MSQADALQVDLNGDLPAPFGFTDPSLFLVKWIPGTYILCHSAATGNFTLIRMSCVFSLFSPCTSARPGCPLRTRCNVPCWHLSVNVMPPPLHGSLWTRAPLSTPFSDGRIHQKGFMEERGGLWASEAGGSDVGRLGQGPDSCAEQTWGCAEREVNSAHLLAAVMAGVGCALNTEVNASGFLGTITS